MMLEYELAALVSVKVGMILAAKLVGATSVLKRIDHLSLVEIINQCIEPTVTERLVGQFEPPPRHKEK
jgi:hypothetical protein